MPIRELGNQSLNRQPKEDFLTPQQHLIIIALKNYFIEKGEEVEAYGIKRRKPIGLREVQIEFYRTYQLTPSLTYHLVKALQTDKLLKLKEEPVFLDLLERCLEDMGKKLEQATAYDLSICKRRTGRKLYVTLDEEQASNYCRNKTLLDKELEQLCINHKEVYKHTIKQ